MSDLLPPLLAALEGATRIALRHYEKVAYELKPDRSLVTRADREVEEFLAIELPQIVPGMFVGEESCGDPRAAEEARESEWVWAVDPIDGTTVFVDGIGTFTICIGLLRDGRPHAGVVAVPALGKVYAAVRGEGAFYDGRPATVLETPTEENRATLYVSSKAHQEFAVRYPGKTRSLGSTALHYLLVARGVAMGALSSGHIWDYAGAAAILEEAGGTLLHLDASPVDWRSLMDGTRAWPPLLGAPRNLWQEVAATVEVVKRERRG
jgi:fructose-1,6-bisphosphatase/inositol monophosphatase family enzyme